MSEIFNIACLMALSAALFSIGYLLRDDMIPDEKPMPIIREYKVIEPDVKNPGWHSYLCNKEDCKHPQHGRKVGL